MTKVSKDKQMNGNMSLVSTWVDVSWIVNLYNTCQYYVYILLQMSRKNVLADFHNHKIK